MIGKAIRAFILDRDDPDLQRHLLRKDEIDILRDIHQVLEIAHSTQESLSAELTPTLSMAMPLYEILIESWTVLKSTIPELSHYIDVALSKLKQYIKEGRKTRIYALSMGKLPSHSKSFTQTSYFVPVLNPDMKFDWISKHWERDDVNMAREWMLETVTLPDLHCQSKH